MTAAETSDLGAAVRRCFEAIYDPCSVAAGTPVSLYDMGLLHEWRLSPAGTLQVTLCVTFGACTMAPHFMRAAEESLARLPGVREVAVAIDHGVQWSAERMSERGRGLLAARSLRFTERDRPRPRQWEERVASTSPSAAHTATGSARSPAPGCARGR